MAKGQLNLRVGKSDFENKIATVDEKMAKLESVIERYGDAKKNLSQFVQEGDSNYYAWCDRIDTNVDACKRAYASLKETRAMLQKTVDQMEGVSSQIKSTIESGTDAAKNVIGAAIKINKIL